MPAPIAVTYANAIRLERPAFIFTVSAFFSPTCLVQVPLQIAYGIMNRTVALPAVLAARQVISAAFA